MPAKKCLFWIQMGHRNIFWPFLKSASHGLFHKVTLKVKFPNMSYFVIFASLDSQNCNTTCTLFTVLIFFVTFLIVSSKNIIFQTHLKVIQGQNDIQIEGQSISKKVKGVNLTFQMQSPYAY